MDRRLQERLIGGVVVIAAAIIFIPELLSGSKRNDGPPTATSAATEDTARTYTIDLEHKSPSHEPVSTTSVETSAPPPEVPPESRENSPAPKPSAEPPPEKRAPEISASPPPPVQRAEETQRTSEPEKPKPQPAKKSPRISSGWSVQVGSFGTSASAARIAQQFELKGFSAYTQPVQVGSKTLYRVRLGPTPERSDAEALLKKIKADQPNATLVSEP